MSAWNPLGFSTHKQGRGSSGDPENAEYGRQDLPIHMVWKNQAAPHRDAGSGLQHVPSPPGARNQHGRNKNHQEDAGTHRSRSADETGQPDEEGNFRMARET